MNVIPDNVTRLELGDATDYEHILGWSLTLDLGGCDSALIDDEVTVSGWERDATPSPATVRANIAAWGERLCAQTGAFTSTAPVIDVFGDDQRAGTSVRIRFDQPAGWRGNSRPTRADAVLRCNPSGHSVHIDILARSPFDPGAVVDFSINYFAARCGTSRYGVRRPPRLIDGFRHDWEDETR